MFEKRGQSDAVHRFVAPRKVATSGRTLAGNTAVAVNNWEEF